jgi:hypothetical protein
LGKFFLQASLTFFIQKVCQFEIDPNFVARMTRARGGDNASSRGINAFSHTIAAGR